MFQLKKEIVLQGDRENKKGIEILRSASQYFPPTKLRQQNKQFLNKILTEKKKFQADSCTKLDLYSKEEEKVTLLETIPPQTDITESRSPRKVKFFLTSFKTSKFSIDWL